MNSHEIEQNIKRMMENFSKENFLYDLLLAPLPRHIFNPQIFLKSYRKAMQKITIILLSSLLLGVAACSKKVNEQVVTESHDYVLNDKFAFSLPAKTTILDSLLGRVQKVNSDMLFLCLVHLPGLEEKQISLSVSCYSGDEAVEMDTIFYYSAVNYVGDPVGDYQALPYSHARYEKDGRILYRKMSTMDGTDLNLMYYTMKDNYDSAYYELKLCGTMADSTSMIDFMEKVMTGSAFVD